MIYQPNPKRLPWRLVLILVGLPLVLVLVVALCSQPPEEDDGTSPTVVLVTIDRLRGDVLSCLGGETPTPALDRLAARGQVHGEMFVPTTSTQSTLVSLHTGLAVGEHEVWSVRALGRHGLGENAWTLAKEARERGRTALAGVSLRQLEPDISGLGVGFDHYAVAPEVGAGGRGSSGASAAETLKALEPELTEALRSDRKLLLWLHFSDLREFGVRGLGSEYLPELVRRHLAPFTQDVDGLAEILAAPQLPVDELQTLIRRRRGSPELGALDRALYEATLLEIDAALGTLWEFLEGTDRWETADIAVAGIQGLVFEDEGPGATSPATGIDRGGTWLPLGESRDDRWHLVPMVVSARGARSLDDWNRPPLRALTFQLHGCIAGRRLGLAGPGDLPPAWILHRESPEYENRNHFTGQGCEPLSPGVRALKARTGLVLCTRPGAAMDLKIQALVEDSFQSGDGPVDEEPPLRISSPERITGTLAGDTFVETTSPRVPIALHLAMDGVPLPEDALLLGRRALSHSFVPRVPDPQGGAWETLEGESPPWAAEVIRTRSGGFGLGIGGEGPLEEGLSVRILAAVYPPGDPGRVLQVSAAEDVDTRLATGRNDAVWITGRTPLDVELELPAGSRPALAVEVDERMLETGEIRYLGRRFGRDSLMLYLPDWLPGVTDDLFLGSVGPLQSEEEIVRQIFEGAPQATAMIFRVGVGIDPALDRPLSPEDLQFVLSLGEGE